MGNTPQNVIGLILESLLRLRAAKRMRMQHVRFARHMVFKFSAIVLYTLSGAMTILDFF